MIANSSIIIPQSSFLQRLHALRNWILFTTGRGQQNSTSHRGKTNGSTGRAKYDGGSGCTNCGCGVSCEFCSTSFPASITVTVSGVVSCGGAANVNGTFSLNELVSFGCARRLQVGDVIYLFQINTFGTGVLEVSFSITSASTGRTWFCDEHSAGASGVIIACDSGSYAFTNNLADCVSGALCGGGGGQINGYSGTATVTL